MIPESYSSCPVYHPQDHKDQSIYGCREKFQCPSECDHLKVYESHVMVGNKELVAIVGNCACLSLQLHV
jgi:hypothetical protein